MKLGMSAFAWTSAFEGPDLDILPFIRDCGFSAIEIPMTIPSLLPALRLRRALEMNDLECTVCAILPPEVNPIHPDQSVREAAVLHFAECIETAAEIGATLIGGPLYAPIGYLPPHRPSADEMKWAVDSFQAVTPFLEANRTTFALEPVNRSETCFLRTVEAAAALCAAINHPLVGITIDTFHANIEEKSVARAMAGLGKSLRHVHASENDRGVLGSGHIDFKGILQALTHERYSGYLIVEGFGFASNGRPSPGALWADTKTSPEQLARESYSYLRYLLNEL